MTVDPWFTVGATDADITAMLDDDARAIAEMAASLGPLYGGEVRCISSSCAAHVTVIAPRSDLVARILVAFGWRPQVVDERVGWLCRRCVHES